MRINKHTWHAELYRRAYIKDRGWIEAVLPALDDHDWPRLPEEEEAGRLYSESCKTLDYKERQRCWKRFDEAREVAYKASIVRTQAKIKERNENLAIEVRDRFEHGRLALCPYFWSVVWAVVFYTLVIRPARWSIHLLGEALSLLIMKPVEAVARITVANAAPIKRILLGLVLAGAAVSLVTYLSQEPKVISDSARAVVSVYEGAVALPSKVAQNWQAHQEENRRDELYRMEAAKLAAEREAEYARKQADWEKAHPDEAKAKKERQVQWEREQKRRRFAERIEFVIDALKIVGVCIAFIAACATLVWGLYAIGWSFRRILDAFLTAFVFLAFIWPEETVAGRAFWAWVDKAWERRRQRKLARQQFRRETWQLLKAYAKAMKERVCPFITFVNDEHGHLSQ